MRRAEQKASRRQWLRTALNAVASALWVVAAQTAMHAQSPLHELPDAPSTLLFSAATPDAANAASPTPDVSPNTLSGMLPGTPSTIAAAGGQQSTSQSSEPSASQSSAPATSQSSAPATSQSSAPATSQSSEPSASQSSAPATAPIPPEIAAPNAQGPPPAPPLLGHTAKTAQAASAELPPCPKHALTQGVPMVFLPNGDLPCQERDQLRLIVDTGHIRPLTSAQKGVLAIRAVVDPFNFLTIAAFSAVSVAVDPHSDYGPGFRGWGRLAGYSLAEDVQGEFTGVYLLPSIFHEDPRYHRMPDAPVRRRIEHALIHVAVSQHDDGALMPNYADLINYPLSAEISNLYVPGLATNVRSTAERVAVGYATEPIGPLVAEFLPDVAEHLHIHILFAQQILNHIALGSGAQSSSLERSSSRYKARMP